MLPLILTHCLCVGKVVKRHKKNMVKNKFKERLRIGRIKVEGEIGQRETETKRS